MELLGWPSRSHPGAPEFVGTCGFTYFPTVITIALRFYPWSSYGYSLSASPAQSNYSILYLQYIVGFILVNNVWCLASAEGALGSQVFAVLEPFHNVRARLS